MADWSLRERGISRTVGWWNSLENGDILRKSNFDSIINIIINKLRHQVSVVLSHRLEIFVFQGFTRGYPLGMVVHQHFAKEIEGIFIAQALSLGLNELGPRLHWMPKSTYLYFPRIFMYSSSSLRWYFFMYLKRFSVPKTCAILTSWSLLLYPIKKGSFLKS